jgi:hypothetical protein
MDSYRVLFMNATQAETACSTALAGLSSAPLGSRVLAGLALGLGVRGLSPSFCRRWTSKWISKAVMSAGFTPPTLDACPIFWGRICTFTRKKIFHVVHIRTWELHQKVVSAILKGWLDSGQTLGNLFLLTWVLFSNCPHVDNRKLVKGGKMRHYMYLKNTVHRISVQSEILKK